MAGDYDPDPDEIVYSDGPPRGTPIYNFYCPGCERSGQLAIVSSWSGKSNDPRELQMFCIDCDTEVEILGREDQ